MIKKTKFLNLWHSIPEKKWMLLLSAVVFIANIQIYSVQIFFQDDYFISLGRWKELGSPPSIYSEGFFFLNRLLCWTAGNVNLYLARSIVLLGILMPLSLLLFRVLRKLQYPLPVALFSAGLISFSPGQIEIPIFINGSYTAESLLAVMIAFWGGLRFLEDGERPKWGWYAFALLAFYYGLRVSELAVPAAFTIALCFLCWRRAEKKAWLMSGSLILLTVYHTYFHIIQGGRTIARQVNPFKWERFSTIFQDFIHWCFPTVYAPAIDSDTGVFIIVAIAALGLLVGFVRGFPEGEEPTGTSERRFAKRGEFVWRVIFPVLLCFSTLVVMTISPHFNPRHAIFPATGLYIFLSFTFYAAFNRHMKAVAVALLLWLSVASMVQHYRTNDSLYSRMNLHHHQFLEFAKHEKYPENAQIVVAGMDTATLGHLPWSSAYLRYYLKRDDISGLIGKEYMLTDPFKPFVYTPGGMIGLNLGNPLFLYRRTERGFRQLTHFLQWKENDIDSAYVIYKVDQTSGSSTTLIEGRGLKSYVKDVETLKQEGVSRSDIMWGGEPSQMDMQRLKQNGFFVSTGTLEKGGIGYVLSSASDKTAIALRKTDTSFKNVLVIKGRIKAALASGVRNGRIVFGENNDKLSNAVVFIGTPSLSIQGPAIDKVQKPAKFDKGKILNMDLSVNIKNGTVVWKVNGNEITAQMKNKPASINYIGYGAWNTKTEFSDLQISGD
jgi:hypothetical protein